MLEINPHALPRNPPKALASLRVMRQPWIRASIVLGLLFVGNCLALNWAIRPLARPGYQETTLDHVEDTLRFRPEGDDSWTPMRAALEAAERPGKGTMYEQVFFHQHKKFQYPPSSLLIIEAIDGLTHGLTGDPNRPLHLIGWLSVWMLTLFSALIYDQVAQSQAAARGGARGRPARIAEGVLVAALAFCFYPIDKGFTLGQIQLWINAGFAASLYAVWRGRETLGGINFGLACLIKPQYGIVMLWALVRRRFRFVLPCLAVAATGTAIALWRYGADNLVDYLRVLAVLSHRGESFHPNFSVNGLLNRIVGMHEPRFNNVTWSSRYPPAPEWVFLATVVTSLVLVNLALLRARRTDPLGRSADFATATLVATMASPIAWEHHYGILAPILALLAGRLLHDPTARSSSRWLLLFAYLTTSNYFAFLLRLAPTPLNFLQSYLLFGALATLVILLRLRNSAEAPRSGAVPAAGTT
ncbi:MAG: glycosyltransferase family 87 protein [Thermoanaerobaculia bacterium]